MSNSTEALFDAVLKSYQITDYDAQIRRYPETYAQHVQNKLMPRAEFERCLKDGFYFGHRTAGLGEFLSFSALPRLIKETYPGAKVWIGPNRFAEAVFAKNPHVDGIGEQPGREPFGSQKEFGFGTTTQRRLLPVGIFSVKPLGPEMTVERNNEWRASIQTGGRKLVFIQSSGRTNPKVFSFFKWSHWLRRLRDEFCFVQIGNLRDQFIWAEHILLKQWKIDEMAAILATGDAFVGPNSGVMHLASAVGVRTVVMHNEALASELVFPVLGDNEVLPGKVNHHLFHCYPWHHHPVARDLTLDQFRAMVRLACEQENPAWLKIRSKFDQEPVRRLL